MLEHICKVLSKPIYETLLKNIYRIKTFIEMQTKKLFKHQLAFKYNYQMK